MSISVPCFAGQVQLQLEPSSLQVGQTGHLTVYMVGGKTLTAPDIPKVDGLLFELDSSFQRFAPSGFGTTLVVGYRYRVTATQEGSFTLGPWDFSFKNREVVRSEPVVLRVKARSESERDAEITATAGFGTDKAWEGQLVVYSYQLEAHVPILLADWRIPDFQGLTAPLHGQAIRLDYDVDDVDGKIMYRGGAVPLVVTGTGQQNHGAAMVSVRLAPTEPRSRSRFYSPKVVQGVTDPAPLAVTSLPDPPDNFSGLVGDFRFQSQLDRAEAPVGAS
ncbi:MAG: hypothetical protein GWP91_24645, partial [Rhodobacterales bacterium]|nr:hypothetical protein [Rhodobacterales bacterium]